MNMLFHLEIAEIFFLILHILYMIQSYVQLSKLETFFILKTVIHLKISISF
jgi:hypothetical protein